MVAPTSVYNNVATTGTVHTWPFPKTTCTTSPLQPLIPPVAPTPHKVSVRHKKPSCQHGRRDIRAVAPDLTRPVRLRLHDRQPREALVERELRPGASRRARSAGGSVAERLGRNSLARRVVAADRD